jgi:HPt (histidine-containing phosphotransfer) domain-containing protein
MSSMPTPKGPPIFSSMQQDPDMAELIEMFVEEMPGRANTIESALVGKDWKTLANEAHKLRGSAGGHGFDKIGTVAGVLEDAVRSAAGREEAAWNQSREQVEQLTNLCRRVAVRK